MFKQIYYVNYITCTFYFANISNNNKNNNMSSRGSSVKKRLIEKGDKVKAIASNLLKTDIMNIKEKLKPLFDLVKNRVFMTQTSLFVLMFLWTAMMLFAFFNVKLFTYGIFFCTLLVPGFCLVTNAVVASAGMQMTLFNDFNTRRGMLIGCIVFAFLLVGTHGFYLIKILVTSIECISVAKGTYVPATNSTSFLPIPDTSVLCESANLFQFISTSVLVLLQAIVVVITIIILFYLTLTARSTDAVEAREKTSAKAKRLHKKGNVTDEKIGHFVTQAEYSYTSNGLQTHTLEMDDDEFVDHVFKESGLHGHISGDDASIMIK
jgi:hypothetical protein